MIFRKQTNRALVATLTAGCICAGTAFAAGAPKSVDAIVFDEAPVLDGRADDPVWQAAPATRLHFREGANFGDHGETTGSIRAARVGDELFLLLQYQDPTHSLRRAPFVKQPDGAWEQLTDPDDVGGDNNRYYEDKAALIWPIDGSINGFTDEGCFTACHDDEPPKAFGNKYTEDEGERGDIWHIKTVRTGPVGQADDQWLDHTRFDQNTAKGAGRQNDAKTGGGYTNIDLVDGVPAFMSKDGRPANAGGTYWVLADDAVPFDDSRFAAGDEVASIMVAPIEGDRGDIALGLAWDNGVWTMELRRKLVTGSATDVQFTDLNASYPFGVAVFDNSQVRHAFVKAPLALAFQTDSVAGLPDRRTP